MHSSFGTWGSQAGGVPGGCRRKVLRQMIKVNLHRTYEGTVAEVRRHNSAHRQGKGGQKTLGSGKREGTPFTHWNLNNTKVTIRGGTA